MLASNSSQHLESQIYIKENPYRDSIQTNHALGDGWDSAALAACLDVRREPIKAALRNLAREALAPDFASDLMAEGLCLAIMAEMARYIGASRGPAGRHRGGLAPWQLRRVKCLIAAHADQRVSLAEIAAAVGLGRRHLMRAYRISTGRTVMSDIADLRFDLACDLLRDTDQSVDTIARRVGFAGASGFASAFSRRLGEPPAAWRRRSRA